MSSQVSPYCNISSHEVPYRLTMKNSAPGSHFTTSMSLKKSSPAERCARSEPNTPLSKPKQCNDLVKRKVSLGSYATNDNLQRPARKLTLIKPMTGVTALKCAPRKAPTPVYVETTLLSGDSKPFSVQSKVNNHKMPTINSWICSDSRSIFDITENSTCRKQKTDIFFQAECCGNVPKLAPLNAQINNRHSKGGCEDKPKLFLMETRKENPHTTNLSYDTSQGVGSTTNLSCDTSQGIGSTTNLSYGTSQGIGSSNESNLEHAQSYSSYKTKPCLQAEVGFQHRRTFLQDKTVEKANLSLENEQRSHFQQACSCSVDSKTKNISNAQDERLASQSSHDFTKLSKCKDKMPTYLYSANKSGTSQSNKKKPFGAPARDKYNFASDILSLGKKRQRNESRSEMCSSTVDAYPLDLAKVATDVDEEDEETEDDLLSDCDTRNESLASCCARSSSSLFSNCVEADVGVAEEEDAETLSSLEDEEEFGMYILY